MTDTNSAKMFVFGVISMVVFIPAAIILIFKALKRIFGYFYRENVYAFLVPFYNTYLVAQHTFGERYGYIGIAIAILNYVVSMLIPIDRLLAVLAIILATLINWWFYGKAVWCFENRLYVKLLAILVPPVGICVLAFSKHTRYLGAKQKAPFSR